MHIIEHAFCHSACTKLANSGKSSNVWRGHKIRDVLPFLAIMLQRCPETCLHFVYDMLFHIGFIECGGHCTLEIPPHLKKHATICIY
mmetsp:Transcript_71639/g.104974  ORF Transcript_71639/g.104974 Transcript_71639/m.104974 type:complete len:87 (+) Transcript_71639:1068-1328(+)